LETGDDEHKRKLSLRRHPIRRGKPARLFHADHGARSSPPTNQWGSYVVEHHHCAIFGCDTWSRSPLWDRETKRPVPGKFKVQVNAWLLEKFDAAPPRSDAETFFLHKPLGPANVLAVISRCFRPIFRFHCLKESKLRFGDLLIWFA
jgi:hypothetical protein